MDPAVKMDVAYMIDESVNIKPKIESMIQSVVNVQEAYARALLVDRKTLREAQLLGRCGLGRGDRAAAPSAPT